MIRLLLVLLLAQVLQNPRHQSPLSPHGELTAINIQSADPDNNQHRLDSHNFRGWVFLTASFACGWFGNLSLFYSGLRWNWRKRLVLGISAEFGCILLAIHGFNLIWFWV